MMWRYERDGHGHGLCLECDDHDIETWGALYVVSDGWHCVPDEEQPDGTWRGCRMHAALRADAKNGRPPALEVTP